MAEVKKALMCSMAVMGRKASPASGVWTCPHAHRSTARGERKRNGIKKRRTHQQGKKENEKLV
jgi:hypothetical protein